MGFLIDEITGDIFGKVCAELCVQGKQSHYRVQDIWLASQAIQYNYKLLTANRKDFRGIPGLQMVIFGF